MWPKGSKDPQRKVLPIGTIITAGITAGWSWIVVERIEATVTRGALTRPGSYVLRSVLNPDREHSVLMGEMHEAVGEGLVKVTTPTNGVTCGLLVGT